MTSIRKRLLSHLILLFVLTWSVMFWLTYDESRHEIEEVFDAALAQEAGIMAELVLRQIKKNRIESTELSRKVYGHKYERKISFQIWQGEHLLLRSQSAPATRLSSNPNFSDELIDNKLWRVFALNANGGDYTIYTAEDYAVRYELITYITRAALYPLLGALPLLAILTWIGIGRGLVPLKRIATLVAKRTPQQLEPIVYAKVPQEIIGLTDALNDLLQRLRNAFDKERRFTSDAAHELRTPLAGIKTQAQVALHSTNKAERIQALENIIRGVDRSTHLVEQMLTLARLEPSALEQNFKLIDLASISQEIIADMAPSAIKKHINLNMDTNCPEESVCRISGYEPGLAILLRNLLDNAICYTPDGGSIELALKAQDKGILLTVTDSGPGIPATERERVLDRFYRTLGHDSYGCGLGLAIVQQIAQLHQAEIRLEDAPGSQGLRVAVWFKQGD